MDVISFSLGVIFAAIFLPVCFIIIVSIRRSILDGSYVDNMSSKCILITGCDSGFGFALAKRLDSLGCHVIATCLTKEGQDRLKEVASSRMTILLMDVTKMESIETVEKRVREILPSADALWGIVNNAGILHYAPLIDFDTLESMKQVSNVNLWGTVAVTKTFLSHLKKSRGRVVNVGSIAGRIPVVALGPYAMSKFGIAAFSDCIRLELSLFGISVHLIEPSVFNTPITSLEKELHELQMYWDNASEELRDEYGNQWIEDTLQDCRDSHGAGYSSPGPVINCLEHALLSTNAKKRYFPGTVSSVLGWWLALCPAEITDFVILRFITPMCERRPKTLK